MYMRRGLHAAALALCFSLLLVSSKALSQAPDDSFFITKDDLKAMLNSPEMTLIDLRFGRDWTDATLKIKGAVREDPMKPGQWIDKYPKEKVLVFY